MFLSFSPDGKNCKTCDRVVSILETKKPELEEFGVRVVRIADRKTAKQNGVLNFPGLSFFKAGKVKNFEGAKTHTISRISWRGVFFLEKNSLFVYCTPSRSFRRSERR